MRRKSHDPKVAIALVRVSTGRQQLGPEAQRAAIRTWAAGESVRVVAWFEEHVSGAADPMKRAGFVSALEAIKHHRAGVLVFHERSRVARDVDMAGFLRVVVRQAGAEVVTADATGSRMEGQIRDVLAEHERKEIGARTRRALAVLRAQGKRVGRHAPVGWRFEGERVVPDAREQAIVERMRRMRTRGHSYQRIAATLNKSVTPPRKGSQRWYPMTVHRALLAPRAVTAKPEQRGTK